MDHIPTYEETIDNGHVYILARCSCGWEWLDNGTIGYNEQDVRNGARVRHWQHLRSLVTEVVKRRPPSVESLP